MPLYGISGMRWLKPQSRWKILSVPVKILSITINLARLPFGVQPPIKRYYIKQLAQAWGRFRIRGMMFALFLLRTIHINRLINSIMDSIMEIKSLKNKEEELIWEVLKKTHWDLVKSARLLKISLSQIKRKIEEFGLKKEDDI